MEMKGSWIAVKMTFAMAEVYLKLTSDGWKVGDGGPRQGCKSFANTPMT